jgi:glycosyltransferase involved in cell wall biosynthesis
MPDFPIVSVVMLTYAHENYIEEAINGVLMQKCNFEVELIIANDTSPDNTDSVVNSLLKSHSKSDWIKYTRHDSNKGVTPNFIWGLQQAKGKYIAICEGDDYWTDPLKLQKQVDFLAENESVGLVSTLRMNLNQENGVIVKEKELSKKHQFYSFNDVIFGCKIATLTVMLKTEIIKKFIKLYMSNPTKISALDYTIWVYISYHSKIAIINEYTAVYRMLQNSLSHQKNKWILKRQYFNDFLFLVKELGIQDDESIKVAIYLRAKSFYKMACYSKDKDSIKIIKDVFLKHKDYYRYLSINLFCRIKILIPLFVFKNKVLVKLNIK